MKSACPQGHPYTAENTYQRSGKRHCKECRRLRARNWYRMNVSATNGRFCDWDPNQADPPLLSESRLAERLLLELGLDRLRQFIESPFVGHRRVGDALDRVVDGDEAQQAGGLFAADVEVFDVDVLR